MERQVQADSGGTDASAFSRLSWRQPVDVQVAKSSGWLNI